MKILLMRLSYIISHLETGNAFTPASPAMIPPVLVPTIMSKTSWGWRPPRAFALLIGYGGTEVGVKGGAEWESDEAVRRGGGDIKIS